MAQNIPLRHYTTNFAILVMLWLVLGLLSFCLLLVYFFANGAASHNDVFDGISAIALVICGLVLYSLPSVLACLSVHPSRIGVYFVNWFLGWSVLGWIVAMIWALSGFNARMDYLNDPKNIQMAERSSSAGQSIGSTISINTWTWVVTIAMVGTMAAFYFAIANSRSSDSSLDTPVDLYRTAESAPSPALAVPDPEQNSVPFHTADQPNTTASEQDAATSPPSTAPESVSATTSNDTIQQVLPVRAANPSIPSPSVIQDPRESKRLNAEGLRMLSGANPDFASARSDFERAFQLDSTNVEALNNLGYVYGRLGDYHTAESTLLKVLDMSPTRKAAQGNLGAIQAELGKTQEAANHYCQYIRLFDSLEHGKSTLTRANKDSDQNIQTAINMALANCN